MIIFPAIDLIGGQVVRLAEGDYERVTAYGDPAETAEGFRKQGATVLHVVDLDGAKGGGQPNFKTVAALAKATDFLQIGGGGRDEAAVERYLGAGASRVVIGSAAAEKPGFLADMARKYPGKIAAGVDARDGVMMIRGWRVSTGMDAFEFMEKLPDAGIDAVIFTDISRDGMMSGPNITAYERVKTIPGLRVIASGGVSNEADIMALKALNIHGAIVGRALLSGALSLERAIKLAEESI